MSNARVIAAVTATLRNLLFTQVPLVDGDLGGLQVTTDPPDVAPKNADSAQINIFLYHAAINPGLRNIYPPQGRPGETPTPPLALNLHFLVTAYGRSEHDLDAVSHRALGAAMLVLHDHPVLGSQEIRDALSNIEPGAQLERLRITPIPLGVDEISKLWTMFQKPYRVSVAYEASVVLIDSHRTAPAPLPVLRRGPLDRGPEATTRLVPSLTGVEYPRSQSAVRLGERVGISGNNLDGGDAVIFARPDPNEEDLVLQPAELIADGVLGLDILDNDEAMAAWWPGFHNVRVSPPATPPGSRDSESLSMAVAPRITVSPLTAAAGAVEFTLTCAPRIRVGQSVILVVGTHQVAIAPANIENPPDKTEPTKLKVLVKDLPAGPRVMRLRVDGVDSIPAVDAGTPPVPSFDAAQTVEVS